MAIYNVDRENYTDNESMSLEEAYEVLSDVLNEGTDINTYTQKQDKKYARDIYWSALANSDPKKMDNAQRIAKKINRYSKNNHYPITNSKTKEIKHYYIQRGKNSYEENHPYINRISKIERDKVFYSKPEKVAGNVAKNKEIIKDRLKDKGLIKEACLTILESLESDED